jgi:nitrile hydratase
MNGVHDLGGMHGLGRVNVEGDEPVFHNPWEKVVFGTMLATMGQGMYNLDEFRSVTGRSEEDARCGTTTGTGWPRSRPSSRKGVSSRNKR